MESRSVYEKQETLQCVQARLDCDCCAMWFFRHIYRTVYVIDDDVSKKVVGIITAGDFKRHMINGGRMVNGKFLYARNDSPDEINKIFAKSERILSVPVIDEDGRLIKEVCRNRNLDENKKLYEIVRQMCREAALYNAQKVLFILGMGIEQSEADAICEETDGKVILKESIALPEVVALNGEYDLEIYDFRFEGRILLSEIYKENKLKAFFVDTSLSESYLDTFETSILYDSVGIFDVGIPNPYEIAEKHPNISVLDPKRVRWNALRSCYEYVDDYSGEDECIEVIYTALQFPKNSCMRIHGEVVPLISLFSFNVVNGDFCTANMADNDVAVSIIPKLEMDGMRCIVIDNLQSNYANWKELLYDYEGAENDRHDERFEIMKKSDNLSVYKKNGYLQFIDIQHDNFTYLNGERFTRDSPGDAENKIFLFGPCIVVGSFVYDDETLGNCLADEMDGKYRVGNYGAPWSSLNFVMREKTYHSGDIAVIFAGDKKMYEMNGIKVHDLMETFKGVPHIKRHIWDMPYHCDGVVTKAVAKRIAQIIKDGEDKADSAGLQNLTITFGIKNKAAAVPEGMAAWLDGVRRYKVETRGKSGSIVMNLNPMTLGHRHLIEYAAGQVDVLYIFVVEEDRSFFKFADRIEMARLGTSDLKNVVLIPSGRYIISTSTLPGYFEKESCPEVDFDATYDLELFATAIAKEFDIKVRFAGEEPVDEFTRKYNMAMRETLPEHGIEFVEIPRKEADGEPISASSVRRHMKLREYDKVRELVLPQVYDYLEANYFHDIMP